MRRKPFFNVHKGKDKVTWPVFFRSHYGWAGTVWGIGAFGVLLTFTLHRL